MTWQIEGEKLEVMTDFTFLGSKFTADSNCSHEIKRHLFLGEKKKKPRQHIKKRRHHFANKSPYSQSYGFSSSHVWMRELDYKENWVLKNWKLLRFPRTARKSNKSILKEINPDYSLEWLMLKLQYFGHLIRRVDSLEKTLTLGKIEARRRRGWQRMRRLDDISDSMDMNLSKFWEIVKDREARVLQFMVSKWDGHNLVIEQWQSTINQKITYIK